MSYSVNIPDFAGSLARGEQIQGSRLQRLAMERELQQGQGVDAALANGGAAALFGADEAGRQSVLQRLVEGGGRQGLSVAMPIFQQQQQRLSPMTPEQAAQLGLRPGTVAMVDGLGRPNILQAPDTLSAEAEAQRRRLQASGGGPETFSAPQEVTDANGQRVLVQFGNRGSVRPVGGGYRAGPQTTGLVPVPGYDAEGRPVALFPDGRGGLVQGQTPPGVSVAPRTREINTGTEIITIDQGGQIVARRPIDIAGREAAEVVGRQQGTEQAAAPQAVRTAEETLAQIDGVLRHRALTAGTGLSGRVLNAIPGTPTYDFSQRVEQLQGRAFLQAFEILKGGGQITEVEGRKATAAIARLSTAQNASDFRTALTELRDVVQSARDRARARGATSGQTAAPGQATVPGPNGGPADPPPQQGGGWNIRPVQ